MKKSLFTLFLTVIIILSIGYGAFVISSSISQKNEKLKEISENQREIDKINKEIEILTKEIENSGSSEFVEKVAREDFGMVKPKEIIYIDKDKDKNSLDNNLIESK